MGQPVAPGITRLRRPRPGVRAAATTLALATFMLLAGCGGDDDPEPATGSQTTPAVSWTLVLDYEPNAVHAGLIRAETAGYFDEAGIDLEIVAPSSTSDALTQVARGRAEIGLADLIDVARRNERALAGEAQGEAEPEVDGAGQVSLAAAIVQRPLSGLIVRADAGIATPEQLAGKRIAVSGLPSDEAVVAAIARKDDQPVDAKLITLGFNGLKALDAGRVDATTAYWPADEVTLKQLGTEGKTFALDKFGGPAYPGLVAFVSRKLAIADPTHVSGFATALTRGTRDVIADPAVGEAAVQQRFPELDASITRAQLERYVPLFGSETTAGSFNQDDLAAFTEFAAASGLTKRNLTVSELTAIPPERVQP